MRLEEFLNRFQKEHQFQLPPALYDSVSILVNRETVVHFKDLNPDCFIIYSSICSIPPDRRESFLEEVLKVNLYGVKTEGMSFGIDEKTRSIVQFYRFEPVPIEYKDIMDKLKTFVAVAKHFKEIFEKL